MNITIDVIIRARDCIQTLPLVLDALKNQQHTSLNIYIVDNSSTPLPRSILPDEAVIIPYTLPKFNYSMAINIAIPYLKSEFVLICSSHTILRNLQTLSYSLSVLNANAEVAAVALSSAKIDELSFSCTDASNFDGLNGAWNTASLYRTSLLRERPFNPEVFTAEDQEWSRWAMMDKGLKIAHLEGSGTNNINPRKDNIKKRTNELVSIAYYSYPEYLKLQFIINQVVFSIKCLRGGHMQEAIFRIKVSLALLQAKFFTPRRDSSYF